MYPLLHPDKELPHCFLQGNMEIGGDSLDPHPQSMVAGPSVQIEAAGTDSQDQSSSVAKQLTAIRVQENWPCPVVGQYERRC